MKVYIVRSRDCYRGDEANIEKIFRKEEDAKKYVDTLVDKTMVNAKHLYVDHDKYCCDIYGAVIRRKDDNELYKVIAVTEWNVE